MRDLDNALHYSLEHSDESDKVFTIAKTTFHSEEEVESRKIG